jgi:hypothetical protein
MARKSPNDANTPDSIRKTLPLASTKTLAPWFPQHARPSATPTRTSWHIFSANPTTVQVMMTFRFHAGPFFSCDFPLFQTRLSNRPRHPSDQVQRRGPRERSCSSDTLPTQPLRTANNRFPEVHLKPRKFSGTMIKDRRNLTGSRLPLLGNVLLRSLVQQVAPGLPPPLSA